MRGCNEMSRHLAPFNDEQDMCAVNSGSFLKRTSTNVLLRRRGEIRKLVRIMKRFRFASGLTCAFLMCGNAIAFSQASTDAVRVTMSMHPDGSRTVYNFDNAQHTATATTTDPDGKVRQTIRYQLDNAGRFSYRKKSTRVLPSFWSERRTFYCAGATKFVSSSES